MADVGITAKSGTAFDPTPGASYAPADQDKAPTTGSFARFVGEIGLNGSPYDGTPGPYQYGRLGGGNTNSDIDHQHQIGAF